MADVTRKIDILVAGDSGVGKTSLIKTLIKDECRQEYTSDMNITLQSTRITLESKVYTINFFDGSSDKSSFQNKDIYFLLYGINDIKTFENINKKYLSKISNKSKENSVIFLIGTKLDRCVDINQYGFNAREVDESNGKLFADNNNIQFTEICAMTKKNTHTLWNDALRLYNYNQTKKNSKNNNNNKHDRNDSIDSIAQKASGNKCCCTIL